MDDITRHQDGLDPAERPGHWEALIGSIVAAAEPELRRRAEPTMTAALLDWARPALSAAATVAILLSASLVWSRGAADVDASEPAVASALVPEELAAWLVAGYQPTVTEVVAALEEVGR